MLKIDIFLLTVGIANVLIGTLCDYINIKFIFLQITKSFLYVRVKLFLFVFAFSVLNGIC